MSNSIEELYEYDLVKKCCRCKDILLKSNFHKKTSSKDGLDPRYNPCLEKYYLDDRDRVKQYYLNIQDRLNKYQKKDKFENKEKIIL